MRMPSISSLYGRIFATFWFTMLLVLIIVLSIQHFDPRKMTVIPEERYQQLLQTRDNIQNRFAQLSNVYLIAQKLRRESRDRPKRDDRHKHDKHPQPAERADFFITTPDGQLIAPEERRSMKEQALRNFVTNIDDSGIPRQRLYGQFLIAGPLPIQFAKQNYQLYIGINSRRPPSFLLQLFDHPIQLLLVTMLVSTPLLLWLAWALSQPARRLEQAARRVARGELNIDPSLERGSAEFRQAGASFNKMVEAVNQMISRQQRLLSDISHELRSPLTRLGMASSLAKRKQGSSTELERIETETQRLETMISHLLELSRMQVDSHQKREKQPLQSLWEALLDDAQYEAEQTGKSLTFSNIPDRTILCYPPLLISALENTIRNAIYYSRSSVNVDMKDNRDLLTVTVEDDGSGVPEDERESIFRPFYRVSTARDPHSGGTGLGLAITESAIQQHNGRIHAHSSDLGGLKIVIELPLI